MLFRHIHSAFLASVLAVTAGAHAQAPADQPVRQRDKPADATELSQISDRGRLIASYDAAAWHATDAVKALNPPKDSVGMYIGRRTPDGWQIAFGRLDNTHEKFLLAYLVTTKPSDPQHPVVEPSV